MLVLAAGMPGSGKSYWGTNDLLENELLNGTRTVCTQLPLEVDKMCMDLAHNKPHKAAKFRERIMILEDKLAPVIDDATGKPFLDKLGQPVMKNMVKCFWRFCPPGTLIIIDESADIWNAHAHRETREAAGLEEGELQSYINHHRHYRNDVFIMCQSIDDVDKQIREKFEYIYVFQNSLKLNIVDQWYGLGIKWPVQFFIMEIYHRSKPNKKIDGKPIWPNARGYTHYRSFSASGKLKGKATAKDGDVSSDFGMSYFKRMAGWSRRLGLIFAVLGMLGFAVYSFFGGVYGMLDSADASAKSGRGFGNYLAGQKAEAKKVAVSAEAEHAFGLKAETPGAATPATNKLLVGSSGSAVVGAAEKVKEPPRVVFVGPGQFKLSDGTWVFNGDDYEGKTILRIDVNFIWFTDGTRIRVTR